jgi:hypothetical protein
MVRAALCLLLASTPAGAEGARTVFFAGLDAGHSRYGHAGFKHALAGPLDAEGFLAMAIAGAGGRRGEGRHAQAAVLVGYQWVLPRWHLAAFAGPELERDGRVRAGLRVQGEVWARPLDDTLLTLTVIAGSAQPQAWARLSAGYRLWADVHVGPEASYKREPDWREARLGLHVTGLELAGATWRVSAGRSFVGSGRDGFYLALSGHVRLGE